VTGAPVFLDYMIHEAPAVAAPRALLVLIAGGALNAGIVLDGSGGVSVAGGNYLVRSAHLFAAQGYRVLTIDRPDDYLDYYDGLLSSSYDDYRISMMHAVDLSAVINRVNTTGLPVVLVGTSRGAISVAAQHRLAELVAMSSPVTSGSSGFPVGTAEADPADVTEPAYVLWHRQDACTGTTPGNAELLALALPDGTGQEASGGFIREGFNTPDEVCGAFHYHGFYGIESCTAALHSSWLDDKVSTLPTVRPSAASLATTVSPGTTAMISLAGAYIAGGGGALSVSLPHIQSSLGGSLMITGDTVTYTPAAGVSNTNDTFVYVVKEAGGG